MNQDQTQSVIELHQCLETVHHCRQLLMEASERLAKPELREAITSHSKQETWGDSLKSVSMEVSEQALRLSKFPHQSWAESIVTTGVFPVAPDVTANCCGGDCCGG